MDENKKLRIIKFLQKRGYFTSEIFEDVIHSGKKTRRLNGLAYKIIIINLKNNCVFSKITVDNDVVDRDEFIKQFLIVFDQNEAIANKLREVLKK